MSSDEWRRLAPLLDAVLDTEPEKRETRISELCGDDTQLAAQLRTLAIDGETPHPLLDGTAARHFAHLIDEEGLRLPAALTARFRVERELGRGGMATVYLAHDLVHDRLVALKVMRPAAAGSGAEAIRFDAEIRFTARLHHPQIVPLFDSARSEDCAFFVMPYFAEGTLAARIELGGPLPVPDALRLASDIAAALAHAHAAGFVHRDVKPSNILLAEGRGFLADFGIARLVARSAESMTASGVAIGTPRYMSPEQAAANATVDARSDIYAAGTVLYEMLTGQIPPSVATRETMAADTVDSMGRLRAMRPAFPASLIGVVERAMALTPEARYPTATAFGDAIAECGREADAAAIPRPSGARLRGALIAVGATVAVAVGLAQFLGGDAAPLSDGAGAAAATAVVSPRAVDTTLHLLLPYEYGRGTNVRFEAPDRFADALAAWRGLRVVDRIATDAALAPFGRVAPTAEQARRAAIALRAGRLIRREVLTRGPDAVLRVSLIDATDGAVLADIARPLPLEAGAREAALAVLADEIVLGEGAEGSHELARWSHSRPALQSFVAGRRAVDRWDLAHADSLFTLATELDPALARAHLWLAQVRVWRGMPSATWRFAVARAQATPMRLPHDEGRLVGALDAYARGDTGVACARWSGIAVERADFASLYGAARCHLRDPVVVRDRRSPSGWRFRGSVHSASTMLRQAFEILPATHREFRDGWYWSLGTLLFTSPTEVRLGRALPPDTGFFAAYPSWSAQGDSLLFVPLPIADFAAGGPATIPGSRGDAVRRQRAMFREIATTWHSAFPRSSDAMLALAIAMDDQGDAAAVDSAVVARRLASDPDERLRAAATEVWLRVKQGVPGDLGSLARAKYVADSVLNANPAPSRAQAATLASLAALTGRADRAATLERLQAEADHISPLTVPSAARALLAYAALGGPGDSLAHLERRLGDQLATSVEPNRRVEARDRWLTRAVSVGFPVRQSEVVRELARAGDMLATTAAAFLARDSALVRGRLLELGLRRRVVAPEDLKLEAIVSEAWLLAALGDSAAALAWIAPTLDAQERSSARRLSDVVGPAMLVRAMAFRAHLERARGDPVTARAWARAARTLWQGADPFQQEALVRPLAPLAR